MIESTESSNRLEGIVVPQAAMDRIIESGRPLNSSDRSEAEVAGYRQVLGQIHDNAENIPLTSGVIRQFHRDLMQFTAEGGGEWKRAPNSITINLPDGTQEPRARTTEPFLVDVHIDGLIERFDDHAERGKIDPLILIALFVLDFLCIHPFSDGNGRMSRLLTVLLLYHQKYRMVGYISLERIIEQSKGSYYETLHKSDQGWHDEGRHDLAPWVEYFLGVLVSAGREFTEKVESVSSAYGMKKALVIAAIDEMIGSFSISELGRRCPSVGRDTIRATLRNLKQEGYLEVSGFGRGAKWRKTAKSLPQSPARSTS